MENNMILHEDRKIFLESIRITSDYYGTREIFVEKDYWATYLLKNLSQADFKDKVVFKGGTSLSKAYDLINRFSEDVDLAILNAKDYSGNAIKELIKRVEETLTVSLKEVDLKDITIKGSRIRRTAYNYEKVISHKGEAGILDKIVLEINSFANLILRGFSIFPSRTPHFPPPSARPVSLRQGYGLRSTIPIRSALGILSLCSSTCRTASAGSLSLPLKFRKAFQELF